MKPVSSIIFPQNQLFEFIDKPSFSGFTKEALIVFITDLLSVLDKNILLQFDSEDEAFSFYRSASEYSNSVFLYYPMSLGGDIVPGFNTEESRYQKESVLNLSSTFGFCCIGTEKSFLEKIIPKNVNKSIKKIVFSVGSKIEISTVISFLSESGYDRSELVYEPGFYSNRGDVLDVFPKHFKKPFRISFIFDEVESISSFDTSSQLTENNHTFIALKEYKEKTETIDNVDLIKTFPGSFRCFYSKSGDGLLSGEGDFPIRSLSLYKNKDFLISEKRDHVSENIFLANGKDGNLDFFKTYPDALKTGFLKIGFYIKENKTRVVSLSEFSKRAISKTLEKKEETPSLDFLDRNSITGLSLGDYIVHRTFGVGVFKGLVFREENKKIRESVEIEYGGESRVFVSLDQLSLVHRYVGAKKEPKVSSLGSKRWASELKKTKQAVSLFAKELVALYTEKNNKRGFRYLKQNDLDGSLGNSFSFIETPDQEKAIKDVYSDMNSEKPMDRLICGDVGFGKTEVAIRAIFKSCLSEKVSVLLCPTTILADQHYITCKERLGPLGVSIGLLSRFKSKKEQQETLKDLKNNKIDVLVGTHRVLSPDVVVPEMGLLIIDEEHRFGVGHKEKIRTLKSHLDVLTLTATPIPRTLQQSLVGLRDLSTILTPPKSRKPIHTSVRYFDWGVIFSNIEAELERGGQVYFLHNDIKTIPSIIDRFKSRFKKAKIEGISGKMASSELEPLVLSFFAGKIDVLVCTTIIESGLDVTNANSIIINNAQDFGLSQLYQIRGRVGRGVKQAHCLLLVPQKPLSRDAHQRLKAVEQNNALGSGYEVSIKDLEIRGAGSLFGYKQSGNISMIGFELYCEILKEEIDRVNGSEKKVFSPIVVLDSLAEISDEYIQDRSVRIDYYFKISRIKKKKDLLVLKNNLIDRFGSLPKELDRLLGVALAKILFKKTNIVKIEIKERSLSLTLSGLGVFVSLESLFDKLSNFKNPNFVNYHYKKNQTGDLVIVFSTKNIDVSMMLLFDCEDFFDKNQNV